MTHKKARLLGKLLTEIVKKDNGFVPTEAFKPFNDLVSVPYAAALITRLQNGKWEIFLAFRGKEETFPETWHIPGRRWLQPHTEEEGCQKTVTEEVDTSAKVVAVHHFDTKKWNEHHPQGKPLEVFYLVSLDKQPTETKTGRFFPLASLPTPMVPYHPEVISKLHEWLRRPFISSGQ